MSSQNKGSTPGLFTSTSASPPTAALSPTSSTTEKWQPSHLRDSASQVSAPSQHTTDELPSQKDEVHQSSSESDPVDGHDGESSHVSRTKSRASIAPDGTFYPEGGLRAWLVVFGSFCGLLAALGLMNTVGVYQGMYYCETRQRRLS